MKNNFPVLLSFDHDTSLYASMHLNFYFPPPMFCKKCIVEIRKAGLINFTASTPPVSPESQSSCKSLHYLLHGSGQQAKNLQQTWLTDTSSARSIFGTRFRMYSYFRDTLHTCPMPMVCARRTLICDRFSEVFTCEQNVRTVLCVISRVVLCAHENACCKCVNLWPIFRGVHMWA